MVVILIIASGISATLGIVNNSTEEWLDAAVITVIVLMNAILGFLQEYRAEKTIEALRSMAALKANVLRDGKLSQVDSRDLVILPMSALAMVLSEAWKAIHGHNSIQQRIAGDAT
jgi:Ca2+-transporting ATPase